MHAATQNVYQYQGTNREHSVASVPVQTKVIQRTLSYTENVIAPELHIGQKEKRQPDQLRMCLQQNTSFLTNVL